MEQSYGVGITNRFNLFLDGEDDPLDVLKIVDEEKEAKKKTKIAEKENKGKPETKAKSAPERKGFKETSNVKTPSIGKPKEGLKGKEPRVVGPRPDGPKPDGPRPDGSRPDGPRPDGPRFDGPRPPRGDRPFGDRPERTDRTVKFSSESREERNNRQNREDRPYQSGGDFFSRDREPGTRPDGDRFAPRGRGGMGRGMGRGMRGGRGGYDNRGKREYDRQSGSDKTDTFRGVKAVDKREGGGARNWGSHRDDIDELNTSANETQDWSGEKPEETSTDAVVEPKEGETAPATGEPAEESTPAEPEPEELTLDEWKALRKSRSKPQYNLRKAGEGEDPSQWKKMYALDKKKEELEGEEEEELEYDASEYPQRVGRLKHVLDIEVVFGDSSRRGSGPRGRGRGGPRGMGRGRGGMGGERGDRPERLDRGDRPERVDRPDRPERDGPRGPPREFDPATSPRGGPAGLVAGAGIRRNDFNKPAARPPKVDDEHDFPSLG